MKTTELPLPEGVRRALFIDGVREIIAYSIQHDQWLGRWTAVVNDERRDVVRYCPVTIPAWPETLTGEDIDRWADEQRPSAINELGL